MGAVICIGCREPFKQCACSFLNEAESGEQLAAMGSCDVCERRVPELYQAIDYGRLRFVCESCLPICCTRCNLTHFTNRGPGLCEECAQEAEHWE